MITATDPTTAQQQDQLDALAAAGWRISGVDDGQGWTVYHTELGIWQKAITLPEAISAANHLQAQMATAQANGWTFARALKRRLKATHPDHGETAPAATLQQVLASLDKARKVAPATTPTTPAQPANDAARFLYPAEIRIDGGTQSRAGLDEATVAAYAEQMAGGHHRTFPPLIVFYDGSALWLADGFHRLAAFQRAYPGQPFLCEVRQGTRRDAQLYACGANATHGLPRSNADKRRAVETLLADEEWRRWSANEIARRCKVSVSFVTKIQHDDPTILANSERTYTTRHGTTATMQTANIGQRLTSSPAENAPPPPAADLGPPPSEDYEPDSGDEDEGQDEAAPAPAPRALPLAAANHAQEYDGDEWYTPAWLLDLARQVLGGSIDLDPASCEEANRVVQARRIYTKADDGLTQWWSGAALWCNPPYSRGLVDQFAAKFLRDRLGGTNGFLQGLLLVNSATETDWFQSLLQQLPACFLNSRVRFYHPERDSDKPRQPQAIFYAGANSLKFCQVFGAYGTLVSYVSPNVYADRGAS